MELKGHIDETPDTSTFGLQLLFYHSEEPKSHYKHEVCKSSIRKRVRDGNISIRLESKKFEADIDVGEEKDLIKFEKNYRGEDFEHNFACRFKDQTDIQGVFGKVIVKNEISDGSIEEIFNLNLTKREEHKVPNLLSYGTKRAVEKNCKMDGCNNCDKFVKRRKNFLDSNSIGLHDAETDASQDTTTRDTMSGSRPESLDLLTPPSTTKTSSNSVQSDSKRSPSTTLSIKLFLEPNKRTKEIPQWFTKFLLGLCKRVKKKQFEDLKKLAKSWIFTGELEKMKELTDLLESMQQRDLLGPYNFKTLKEMVSGCGPEMNLILLYIEEVEQKRTFICTPCERRFRALSGLRSHQRAKHRT